MSRVIFIESGGVKLDALGGHQYRNTSETSHSFDDVDLGASSSSGLLVIGAGIIGSPTSEVNSLTVNGSSATQVASAAGGGRSAKFFQITGQSGTGDIAVECAAGATQWFLGLWKLRGVQSTTAAATGTKVGSLTESPLTVAFDVPKLGAGIAFMIGDVTGGGTTWSGLTEDFEITDAINGRGTGASLKFNTAQTALSVSATTTITGRGMLVGASWR